MAFGVSHERELGGYLAPIASTLGEYSLKVLDWQSVAIRDRAIISILIEIHPDHTAPLDEDLQKVASELGIDIATEYQPFTSAENEASSELWHGKAILAAAHIPTALAHSVTATLLKKGAQIGSLNSSRATFPTLEIEVSLPADSLSEIRSEFAALRLQVALVERNRSARRLFVFDMDSTVINQEVIDELALRAGKGAEVAGITESAMRGEIDFSQSLAQRVQLLAGLPVEAIAEVRNSLTLTEGLIELFAAIARNGDLIAVVSGGFHNVIDPLLKDLGVDYILANTLETDEVALTGKIIGRVIDGQVKAEFLKETSAHRDIHLRNTIAIGDGANDREMLALAGLGIAFCAKPALVEIADLVISERNLALIIPLTGL